MRRSTRTSTKTVRVKVKTSRGIQYVPMKVKTTVTTIRS